MKSNLIALVVTVIILCACSSGGGSIKGKKFNDKEFTPSYKVPEVDSKYYSEALKKLKSEGAAAIESVDFVKFRYSYIQYALENKLDVPTELERQLKSQIETEKFSEVSATCDSILEIDFTDLNAHMVKAFSLKMLGKDYEFNDRILKRLEESMLASGDGKTKETAFHVAQIKEEYFIISSMELMMEEQALDFAGAHAFDVMSCKTPSGTNKTLYFDITEHMINLSNMLEKSKKKK